MYGSQLGMLLLNILEFPLLCTPESHQAQIDVLAEFKEVQLFNKIQAHRCACEKCPASITVGCRDVTDLL